MEVISSTIPIACRGDPFRSSSASAPPALPAANNARVPSESDLVLEPRLIDLLRCPITKRPLLEADQQLLAALNAAIEQGQLTDQMGHPLTRRLDSALIDTQSEYAIPVFDRIPTLIPDEMIPLAQLDEPRGINDLG